MVQKTNNPTNAGRQGAAMHKSAAGNTTEARKPWNAFATPLIGKLVRAVSRLLRHGGSALPGKVVEGIDPGFLARTLAQPPLGVVLVSGTNGKTTTTRMIATMLEGLGLRVFTNPTGSNFTRGVVSALLERIPLDGALDADIAVLELDEAYAVRFVQQVRPEYALLLNVMRDQLDRFGEIDNTARLLGKVARATTGTVLLNREDPRIAALAALARHGVQVKYFGLAPELRSLFPSDDDLYAGVESENQTPGVDPDGQSPSPSETFASGEKNRSLSLAKGRENPLDGDFDSFNNPGETQSAHSGGPDALPADVTLAGVGDHAAEYRIDEATLRTAVKLEGAYNLFNAAAALAVTRAVMANTPAMGVDSPRLMYELAKVTPAFGRGEVIHVNDTDVELLLVKNPMGFRLSLASFRPQGHETMIAICDEYADGRDMSWLWDVDFTSLRGGVAMVSGTRAWDMTLRLGYDEVPVDQTNEDLEAALEYFVTVGPGVPKRIYCTYTAMLRVRAKLAQLGPVADVGVGRQ